MVLKHGEELARRSRQEDCGLAARREDAAGCGSKIVRNDNGIFGEARLLIVVGRHGISARGEVLGEFFHFFRHGFHGHAERRGDGFLCQVVVRRPQPAGKHHHVRAFYGLMHNGGQALDVVPDGGMVKHLKSERREPLGDELCVRIDDLSHEKLRTDGDDFRYHSVCPSSITAARSARPERLLLI